MITVKQFLDAGFKLMVGDVLVAQHITSPLNSADMEAIDFGVTEYIDYKIKSLSWRKNKGEQPVADGLMVDALLFNDKEITNQDSQVLGWGLWGHIATGFHIKQWKPNLAALEQQMNDKQDMMTQAESDDIEQLEKSALEMSERDVEDVLLASPFDACTSSEDSVDSEWRLDDDGMPPIGVDVMVSYTVDGDPDGWRDAHGPSQLVALDFGMVWIAHHGVHHRLHKAEDVEFTKYVKPESSEEKAAREFKESVDAALNSISKVIDESANCDISASYAILSAVKAMIKAGYQPPQN